MVRPLLSIPVLALAPMLHAQDVHVRVDPAVTTGIEGTDAFPTIQNALDHHPFAGPGGRVIIAIKPGIYHERIVVTQNHQNITLQGTGTNPEETVITNSLNAKQAGGTFLTQTAEIDGDGFEADNLTLENTAGNTGQAVAAAVRADRSVFKHVRFLGHQDTLFADFGRHFYTQCYIEGGVDYIFGNAAAVFQDSELHSNGPGFVTAQSRTSADQTTGYVIFRSHVTSTLPPANAATQSPSHRTIGLGRPWRPYSRVVYLDTSLPADLDPAGWNNWGKVANQQTAFYAESGSTGPGANPTARVPWARSLTPAQRDAYLPQNFLAGSDRWDAVAAAAKLP